MIMEPIRRFASSFALLAVTAAALAGCSHGSKGECHERYSLINSVRRCNTNNLSVKREYEEFSTLLRQQINEWQQDGHVSSVAVYFRDLEGGPWFGINEDDEFYPASLLKTPIMMAVLKQAENDLAVLDEILSYDEPMPPSQDNAEPWQRIEPKKPYPLREVIRRMMVYSDNRSQQLLLQWLNGRGGGDLDLLGATLDDIGLLPANGDLKSPLTVKSYSSLFRLLYNAQYLNRDMSQFALDVLSQSNFKTGLVAGIPQGVVVAHKFGIWEGENDEKLLHDCGIVYHPATPYLLCVMTRSDDLTRNAEIIGQISEWIYHEVELHDEPHMEKRNL